jgi:hypothetical protein
MIRAAPRLAAATALIAVVGWSSALALRYASVGDTTRSDELISLRPLLQRGPTLALFGSDYMRWELFGVNLSTPVTYHWRSELPVPARPPKVNASPFDFDTVDPAVLDRFRFAVTVRGAHGSRPPAAWRPVRSTRSFTVWERRGASGARAVLPGETGIATGAPLRCDAAAREFLRRQGGVAGVRFAPVYGFASEWRAGDGRPPPPDPNGWAVLRAGRSVRQAVALQPGRWELALAYHSPVPLTLRAAGRRFRLPASSAPSGELWRVGTVSHRGGPLEVSVRAGNARPGLLHRDGRIQHLAAVRPDGDAVVPLVRACGRYVDWYRPGA